VTLLKGKCVVYLFGAVAEHFRDGGVLVGDVPAGPEHGHDVGVVFEDAPAVLAFDCGPAALPVVRHRLQDPRSEFAGRILALGDEVIGDAGRDGGTGEPFAALVGEQDDRQVAVGVPDRFDDVGDVYLLDVRRDDDTVERLLGVDQRTSDSRVGPGHRFVDPLDGVPGVGLDDHLDPFLCTLEAGLDPLGDVGIATHETDPWWSPSDLFHWSIAAHGFC